MVLVLDGVSILSMLYIIVITSSFLKIIRCGGNDDAVTLKCQDNSDSVGIVIENAGTYVCVCVCVGI